MIEKIKGIWQFFKPLPKQPCNVGDVVQVTTVNSFRLMKETTGIIDVPTFEAVYEGSPLRRFF